MKEDYELDQAIKSQKEIFDGYTKKMSRLKVEFNDAISQITTTQSEYNRILVEYEKELKQLSKKQKEMYCMMLITKDVSLDHLKLYHSVQLINNKDTKDLIVKRFFPQIEQEQQKRKVAESDFMEEYSELNISSLKMVLQKVKEKLEF